MKEKRKKVHPTDLKKLLKETESTQVHAAQLLRRDPRTIRKWIAGKSFISWDEFCALTILLKLETGALVDYTDIPK